MEVKEPATKEQTPPIDWPEPSALPAPRAQVVHRIDDDRIPSGKTQPIERAIVRHSEEIDQLFAALAVAQGGFDEVERTLTAQVESRRTGGKYAYEYETLADIIRATRKPLSENGLALMQFPFPGQQSITIRTMLTHKSGQWIYNDLTAALAGGLDPQSVGSGITYLMRYARKAILGIAAGYDDDGAAATKPAKPTTDAPAGYPQWLDDMRACADEGTEKLQAAWTTSKPEYRKHLTTAAPGEWAAIKDSALKAGPRKAS